MCISNGRAFPLSHWPNRLCSMGSMPGRDRWRLAWWASARQVPHFIDVGMKRAFDAWHPVGPRVFAGGYFPPPLPGMPLRRIRQSL